MKIGGRILFVIGLSLCLYSFIIGQLNYLGIWVVLMFGGFVMQDQERFLSLSGSCKDNNRGSDVGYSVDSSGNKSTTDFSDSGGGDSSGGDD